MTNLTDEKILEFCHAEEVWVWDDDPKAAVNGKPDAYVIDATNPFSITQYAARFRHFSLEKPQAYEDGKWYSAKVLKVLNGYIKICCHYNSQLNRFICDGIRYSENELTNIRPIPEEMWSD